MNTRKGRKACIIKPTDEFALTPLFRLIAMAYLYEQKLRKNKDISQRRFCKIKGISPRYLRGILHSNFLSPKLKQKITNGWLPKNFTTQQILTGKIPLLWSEQEKMIV